MFIHGLCLTAHSFVCGFVLFDAISIRTQEDVFEKLPQRKESLFLQDRFHFHASHLSSSVEQDNLFSYLFINHLL